MIKSATKQPEKTFNKKDTNKTPSFEQGAHTRQYRISALKELKEQERKVRNHEPIDTKKIWNIPEKKEMFEVT